MTGEHAPPPPPPPPVWGDDPLPPVDVPDVTGPRWQSPGDELEAALIGSFVLSRRHGDQAQAVALVEPRHLEYGRNRTMWEHAVRMWRDGQALDMVTLTDALDRAGHLDAAGGMVHVGNVVASVPTSTALVAYAERVHGQARRRLALTAASDLVAALQGDAVDVEAVIRDLVPDILSAARRHHRVTFDPDELMGEVEDLWRDGPDTGWDCGWREVDRIYRPSRRQLSVITGVPSAGKSSWVAAYLSRLADRHGFRWACFSPEVSTPADWTDQIVTMRVGSAAPPDAKREAARWALDRFRWVDHMAQHRLDDILAAFRYVHETTPGGIDGVLIDPWNWVDAERPAYVSETDWIGQCLRRVVAFAQDLDVHAFVVAHPRKVAKRKGKGKEDQYEVPGPYDISGSAHWYNAPWFCVSLWRDINGDVGDRRLDPDRDPTVVEVHSQKVRPRHQGRVGVASLRRNPSDGRFAPLAREDDGRPTEPHMPPADAPDPDPEQVSLGWGGHAPL